MIMPTIAVIGGGIAGSVIAKQLADQGLNVVIAYRQASNEYKAGETLPPNANNLLSRLGITHMLESGEHMRCPGNQSAFGLEALTDVDFLYSPQGLGWHLDRVLFEKQLLAATKQSGVHQLANYRFLSAERKSNKWLLSFSTDDKSIDSKAKSVKEYYVDYVIDASGTERTLVKKLAIQQHQFDQMAARVAVFNVNQTREQQDHRTMIEASENGWWYSSSAPNSKRIVMFFGHKTDSVFRTSGKFEYFVQHLQQTKYIWQKLQNEIQLANNADTLDKSSMLSNEQMNIENVLKQGGAFYTKPAFTSLSTTIQGQGWLAIGDAAMAFDPLSSQGMYIAMQGAEKAAEQIQYLYKNNLLTSEVNVSKYTQWAEKTFQTYMQERQKYYALEQRWPNSTFWQQRAQDTSLAAISN